MALRELCLPAIVQAICAHVEKDFDTDEYVKALQASVNEQQRHNIVIERWKARVKPSLAGIIKPGAVQIARVSNKSTSLDKLVEDIPTIFDANS